MSQTLGLEKRKFLFSCSGMLSIEEASHIITNLIKFIGMTPAREPRFDEYPYLKRGGVGYTGFFPLMESYIVVDAYTELNQIEILLSTCKPDRMVPCCIISFLEKEIGITKFIGTL
jgi:hypothetical protein